MRDLGRDLRVCALVYNKGTVQKQNARIESCRDLRGIPMQSVVEVADLRPAIAAALYLQQCL
jgi:hypothetical protein